MNTDTDADCDSSGDCGTCLDCVYSSGMCADQHDDCMGSQSCLDLCSCYDDCGGGGYQETCLEMCETTYPDGIEPFNNYYQQCICVACASCLGWWWCQ